jgi:UTP--glucose-1-phosphate uridylyltransferase
MLFVVLKLLWEMSHFAILFGDDIVYNEEKPCLKQLINCYNEYKTIILGVQTVAEENVSQ